MEGLGGGGLAQPGVPPRRGHRAVPPAPPRRARSAHPAPANPARHANRRALPGVEGHRRGATSPSPSTCTTNPATRGVLVAHGGQASGYVLYVEDGALHFEVNSGGPAPGVRPHGPAGGVPPDRARRRCPRRSHLEHHRECRRPNRHHRDRHPPDLRLHPLGGHRRGHRPPFPGVMGNSTSATALSPTPAPFTKSPTPPAPPPPTPKKSASPNSAKSAWDWNSTNLPADQGGPMTDQRQQEHYPGFGGKIGRIIATSESWWPPKPTPPVGAPNIVIVPGRRSGLF